MSGHLYLVLSMAHARELFPYASSSFIASVGASIDEGGPVLIESFGESAAITRCMRFCNGRDVARRVRWAESN